MKLRNVNAVSKRLASGEVRVYYFHRPTKIALGCDPVEVRRKWEELEARAPAKTRRGDPGTIGWLIGSFLQSTRFTALSPRSQADYRRHLEGFRATFGHLPVTAITPVFVERYREKGRATPFLTNYRLAVLRRAWGTAVRMGMATSNPFSRPEKLPTQRRRALWSPDDAGRLLSASWRRPTGRGGASRKEGLPRTLALAFLLGLYTAQREADVLAMTWDQYRVDRSGRAWISITQAKTRRVLDLPVHADLRRELDRETRRPGGRLIGADLTPDEFRRRFGRWKARAGLAHLRFQDLRRTAMVRMAEAQIPTPLIAAISGHSIDQTQRILEYYIPRTREMALGAVIGLEGAAPLIRRRASA